MQPYLKEVARGSKGARDLTYAAAYEAACRILDGQATPAQVGAFLAAERMKGESLDELAAFAVALRERCVRLSGAPADVLDVAGPSDGRSHSFAATIPTAFVLASLGVPVLLHGSASLPPKYGVPLADILHTLGVPTTGEPNEVVERLRDVRIAYLDRETVCPPLGALRPIREQLGVRTMLNTVDKFLNPVGARRVVAGVFHGTVLERVAQLAARLGYDHGLIVQGIDGSEDVPTHRMSAVCRMDGDEVDKLTVDPSAVHLNAPCPPVSLTAADQAAHVEAVLRGGEHPFRNMVVWNAGLRIWWLGRASSLAEGAAMAAEALDAGHAWNALQAARER